MIFYRLADFIYLLCSCRSVYEDLVSKGVIQPAEEVPPPTVPMDYSWARVSRHWKKINVDPLEGFDCKSFK